MPLRNSVEDEASSIEDFQKPSRVKRGGRKGGHQERGDRFVPLDRVYKRDRNMHRYDLSVVEDDDYESF